MVTCPKKYIKFKNFGFHFYDKIFIGFYEVFILWKLFQVFVLYTMNLWWTVVSLKKLKYLVIVKIIKTIKTLNNKILLIDKLSHEFSLEN